MLYIAVQVSPHYGIVKVLVPIFYLLNVVTNMCINGQLRFENKPQVILLEYKLQGMILNDIVIILESVLRNFQNFTFIWINDQSKSEDHFVRLSISC